MLFWCPGSQTKKATSSSSGATLNRKLNALMVRLSKRALKNLQVPVAGMYCTVDPTAGIKKIKKIAENQKFLFYYCTIFAIKVN